MASLQAKIDAVKASVASTSTCTPANVVTLKELLLSEPESQPPRPKSAAARPLKTPTTARTKSSASQEKAAGASKELLSARERTILATHVINATIKSLTEAVKPAPPATPSKKAGDAKQAGGRKPLRRSISTPLSPIEPRVLNRVATSPTVSATRAKSLLPTQSTGCLATVECARVAFAALRSIKGPIQADNADFQLETGMSALVGKLVALGLHDQALKELRILKRRLDGMTTGKVTKTAAETNAVTSGIADLLDFQGSLPKQSLPTVTGYQMQVLKLVVATKKPVHIEAIVPYLGESVSSSPFNLLSTLAKDGEKEAAKAARQMATMSQIILSLAPSISAQEDAVATEPRLSPSPSAAFELQSLAFRMQLRWWKLAGHKGSIDDDVLSPFSRCARAYSRRHNPDNSSIYQIISKLFDEIRQLIQAQKYLPTTSFSSPLASIYQLLGSAAHSERRYDDAYRWFEELKATLTPGQDSSVRTCSVSARLLAVALKKSNVDDSVEQLTREVIAGLDGSLSGTAAELNELLESLSIARRSVVGLLMNALGPNAEKSTTTDSLNDMLKMFILKYPRFVRRWMGLPPAKDAPPKQVLQFDQRRQLVSQSIGQILDATLMVVRSDIQTGSNDWQPVDDVLQHCVSLLESLSASTLSISKADNIGSYPIKISSLYFSIFTQLRKKATRSKEEGKQLLQALNRSIDSVKDCTSAEKERAQLSTKLEVYADLCKSTGRTEDAVRTLRSICTNMAETGALSEVANALSSQPPCLAWNMNERSSVMSRTLRSIAKLDRSWNDWTFFLPEAERAAVLEHLMHISSSSSSATSQPLRLHDPGLAALLRIYTSEKYPIRRLRVLLHLCYQNLGEDDHLPEIKSLVDEALQQAQKKDKAEDTSLGHYVPHLQAYYASISALSNKKDSFPTALIKDAVASWKTIAASCQSQSDVFAKIDDPQSLLDHLRSLHQLAGLRGESHLQLSISELSISISRNFVGRTESNGDGLVLSHSQLIAQYVNIGLFPQALKSLEETEELLTRHDGLSRRVLADVYISQAEYYTGVGNMELAMSSLSKASEICNSPYSSWAESKSQATMMISLTSLLQSIITLQTGDVQDALSSIKSSVRLLSHDWSKLENSASNINGNSESSLAEISSSAELKVSNSRVVGPRFWNLASPLLRSLLHISSVYAHIGMFQETMYYAESAWKIAESTQSSLFQAQVAAWTGSVYVKAGKLSKALTTFKDAEDQLPQGISASRVQFARQIGEFYWEIGEDEKAADYLKIAEDTAQLLSRNEQHVVEEINEAAVTKSRTTAAAKTVRASRTTKSRTPAAPKTPRRAPATKTKTVAPVNITQLPSDIYHASLYAANLMSRTLGLIHQKDWAAALAALEKLKDLPKLVTVLSQEQVMTAVSLIGHSMEQMILDPVFSVMQDSTISFPAIAATMDKIIGDKPSPTKTPPKRGRAVTTTKKSPKERGTPAFADALRQAQELLMEAHASALSNADSSMVRRISTLLQSTIIFLSATSSSKSNTLSQSGLATVAVDLARNVTWTREQRTLAAPITEPTSTTIPQASQKLTLQLAPDMADFQHQFVDMIPEKWGVVSISLSDNRHDLCITKFQAGQSPFILRLPLERANSRDADYDVFNFEHGREELLDIIKLANESSHSARDFTARGERGAWWEEREALDSRLKGLLATIETTWLGGFKGIFSQHRRRMDLLTRFQKNFHQMLDRSLPSRNKARGKKSKTANVTLEPRILDLFIGLGNPTDPDCDFDEALNDLLYFVVDILQFHGERNAYDEIDFDAMVVETYDALRGYHNAANSADREDSAHTVLVLDKVLHAFPWESLPCMDGLSVSRVPSLACLRQLITEAKGPEVNESSNGPQGHHVSVKSGTYILNPSSDLVNTQSFFEPAFSTLESWKGIVNSIPEESAFEKALSSSDIMVYFGHGSGAQYIRGKTIRRLEKCKPATFLMGCSSAALTDAGEFECYGPVWNYMMAGCPAVVGTLWDVTDRDIDRFAGRTFEEWGLFARGTFNSEAKGKGKSKAKGREVNDVADRFDGPNDASLAEAVARARSVCRFKYLNAAAVVLYGIPVYIKKE